MDVGSMQDCKLGPKPLPRKPAPQKLASRSAVIAWAVALLIVLGVAGEASAAKLRLGYLPVADSISFFAAKDRGFFKKEGLEVAATVSRGSAVAIAAMEGGSLDVAWVDAMAMANIYLKGFDVRFLAPGGPIALKPGNVAYAYLARAKDAGIASMNDLAGKTVGVISLGGISELGLRVLLRKAGVSYKAVKVLEVPFPKMIPALMQRRIDVAAQVEPFVKLMQMKKTGKVIQRGMFGGALGQRWLIISWAAKKSWIEKNKATASAFVRAISSAVRAAPVWSSARSCRSSSFSISGRCCDSRGSAALTAAS